MPFDPNAVQVHGYVIDPARVLEGDPRPSVALLWHSPGGDVHGGIWEVSEGVLAGVDVDELVHVVRGRVTVTYDDGESFELGEGDVATFSRGRSMTWRVHEKFRAVFAGLA
ncbi:hypothetical protein JCM18899A_43660 [Nocardioides sp. AN3]